MSEVITEKELNMLSEKLGEPKGFLEWRKDVLAKASELPQKDHLTVFNNCKFDVERIFSSHCIEYTHKKDLGARVLSWNEAMKDSSLAQTILEYLKKDCLPFSKNRDVALSAALFTGGCAVVAPAGFVGTVTLATEFLENVPDILVVIAGSGARLSLLDRINIGNRSAATTTIVIAEAGAQVEFQSIIEGDGIFLNNKMSIAEKDCEVCFFDLAADVISGKFYSEHFLTAPGASAVVANVLLARGDTRLNICNTMHHLADNTHSLITASGVVGDSSHVTYQGLIDVKNGVRGVVGEQKAKFLMVSPDAKIDAIPALDIASKEISCSHRVSISHLKDKDLYYPKLRGIGTKAAKQLMMAALLNSELSRIKNEEASGFLKKSIAKGISGIL